MSCAPWAKPIREYGRIDDEALAEIRSAGQPAVLRGQAADWPAVAAARQGDEALVDYVKRFPSARRVSAIVGGPEINGRFFYTQDMQALNFQRGVTKMEPFLDRLLRDRTEDSPFAIAVQSEPVIEAMPGFERENYLTLLSGRVPPRVWMGNRIQVAPHYDLFENIGVVAAGRRRFTVFPPEQLANMYPGPFELTPAGTPVSMVDPANPDLDRYPRFKEAMANAQCAELEPGDAIYIPYHWWHGVDSLERVNLFINYWWNDAPPGGGRPYDALMHALFAFKTLPPDQRAVWRTIFDHYVFEANGDPAGHLPLEARGMLGQPTSGLLGKMRMTIKKIAESL
jgi:hypothetical protein